MLDKFIYGKVSRISPEAPVQILNLNDTKEMLGGCGNVIANLASLGCKANYLGIVGNDTNGQKIATLLKKCNSHYKLLKLDDYSTIIKSRFIAGNNHILRVDEERKLPLIKNLLPRYERILRKVVKNADIVLLSDYNKGTFTPESTQMIIKLCKEFNKKVIIDPKGNDYSKYTGADFVKPNLKEFIEATGVEVSPTDSDFDTKIKNGAQKLFNSCNIKNLLITMSEHGILHISKENTNNITKLPTEAKEVFDVSGAGDTTIATFSLAIALGLSTEEAMNWANLAAGIVVGKVGTACISQEELKTALEKNQKTNYYSHLSKIVTKEDLATIIEKHKSNNKIIGFTNGCFDIMHLGHLNSFAEAKKHCDILVVGVNTDKSIKRYKGENRPLQDEETRSNLVAALGYVDYVVLFDEDTALPLVKTIKPNIIAKEGYTITNWTEAQYVESYGGKAVILPRLEGFSTTEFIKRLKNNNYEKNNWRKFW